MIRIVADDSIPGIAQLLRETGHLDLIPGREITSEHVRDAEVLVVRSVTRVDRDLLDGSRVGFVGTATAGVDHVDVEYLRGRGIEFRHAPGANAESVVEYALAALFALAVEYDAPLRNKTIGIVGFGNVGSRLARRLRSAGAHVVVNDPPLEATIGDFAPGFDTADLKTTVRESDVLSLHVPLEGAGNHPTYHLVDGQLLSSMKPGAWFVNTSRGAVVDEAALLAHVRGGESGPTVLDVWETEPEPNRALLARCRLGTPHVAGYSLDAKLAATQRIAREVRRFLGASWEAEGQDQQVVPLEPPREDLNEAAWYRALVRQMFDIEDESERFGTAMLESSEPGRTFAHFRQEHMKRRSFRRYSLGRSSVPDRYAVVGDVLGIEVRDED